MFNSVGQTLCNVWKNARKITVIAGPAFFWEWIV